MSPSDSDFMALQALTAMASHRPADINQVILRAYWLGKGEPLDEVLSLSSPKPVLSLVRSPAGTRTSGDERQ